MNKPFDPNEPSLGFLLYDAARLMRRDFDRRAKVLGLTRAQWSVLAHLRRNEGSNQASIADHLAERVKADGFGRAIVEGEKTGDWAIIDCGDVVVHVFRPEVRAFYDLEAMWSAVAEQRAQG